MTHEHDDSQRQCRRQSGLSLVEVSIATTLLVAVAMTVSMTMVSSTKISATTSTYVDATDNVRRLHRRLYEELRSASRTAEDANDNSALDTGEDVNGNGRLERDWALTSTSITFNRRLSDGAWGLPLTYRLRGTSLERVTMQPSGKSVVAVVATNVSKFDVKEVDTRIVIDIGLQKGGSAGGSVTETLGLQLRN